MAIYAEADQEDIRRVMAHLDDLKKSPRHLKNAINRTTTQAMKMIRAGRSQGYTIKAGRFNSDITVHRANYSHLNAIIKAAGRPPTIQNFSVSKKQTEELGIKASVVREGMKPVGPEKRRGFYLPNGLMAVRRGKARKPVDVIHGPSAPAILEKIYKGERGGQGDMESKIRQRLHEEMEKEIARLL